MALDKYLFRNNTWRWRELRKNSEMRNIFIQPIEYRISTNHKSNNYNHVQLGVWETSIKTKRKVTGTDATQGRGLYSEFALKIILQKNASRDVTFNCDHTIIIESTFVYTWLPIFMSSNEKIAYM